jgi:plasmid stability protein
MATLQVKGMDDRLYAKLRKLAASERRSISQEVTMIIESHIARSAEANRRATMEVLKLGGAWKDKRSAEQIVAGIRRARRSGGRFKGALDVPA